MTDDRFFIRLNNSAFYEEDKKDENGLSLDTKYSLFADENYTDIEFYKDFKTVFHLRQEMMKNTDTKKDIRRYYLALHHIIKYRGHFLYDTDFDSKGSGGIRELFEKFNRVLEDSYTASSNDDGEEDNDDLSTVLRLDPEKAVDFQNVFLVVTDKTAAENIENLENSIKDNKSENNAAENIENGGKTEVKKRLTLTEKKNRLITLFDAKKIKQKEELLALLAGFKIKPSKLFGEKYKDNDESFSFKSTTEEDLEQKRDSFDEEDFAVLEAAREIYKYVQYKSIIGDHEFFSDAMICVYDKHRADLEKLKEFVKKNYDRKVYVDIFKKIEKPSEEKAEENDSDDGKKSKKSVLNNYVRYVGHTNVGNSKITVKKCKPDEFFAFLKKILKDEKNRKTDFDQKTCDEIMSEIEDGEFLPKILHADKGNVPYQCNKIELDKILNNLCKDYPEFNEKDLDGYTLREKIEKIFTFKIPYYVGPLKSVDPNADAGKKPNYWMIRKEDKESETITPRNFDEIVDKEKSNEQFMRRMTNKCTYLYGEDVLPKGSIYYKAFDVLNQINKLTFNGAPISVCQKQDIFNELYKTRKKVTVKDIENYFVRCWKATKDEVKGALGGFDVEENDIKANMNSYVTFKNRFGDLVDERIDVFEKIILWHTLNTDKKMVADLVKRDYGDIFNADDIKWIKGLTSFKDFGRLSKKFLHDETFDEDSFTSVRMSDGIANCTILSELYNTNYTRHC